MTTYLEASKAPGEAGFLVLDWEAIGGTLQAHCVDQGEVIALIEFLRSYGYDSTLEMADEIERQLPNAAAAAMWAGAWGELRREIISWRTAP